MTPFAWQVHFQMGQAIFGKGGGDRAALDEITNAIQMMPEIETPQDRASVHFWRAHVLVQLKDFEDARSEYQQVIKQQPDGQLAGFAHQALALLPALENGLTTAKTPVASAPIDR